VSTESLDAVAGELAARLIKLNHRVVFAESCTGGCVSAAMARVPGISEFLCGSAVTYRNRTKSDWLGVDENLLSEFGAVSEPVTRQMAVKVLAMTPEAHWGASVTGHLGPGSPDGLDGVVFTSVARRFDGGNIVVVQSRTHRLASSSRAIRQHESATRVLRDLCQLLCGAESG
jgi:PncC family amidohydrolase